MAEIKVSRAETSDIKVRVGQQNAVKVISSLAGAQGLSLSELSDVNVTDLLNGMVLVYNSETEKWDATLSLTPGTTQNLDINGGNF
jgi:hypothetical protein